MNTSERFHQLSEQASRFAKAKSEADYLNHFRKSKLAILMKKYEPSFPTAAAQEREARADPEYIEILQGLRAATEACEKERWELKLVEMKFESWRTKEATKRAEMKL
jgi:hypothetical protein